ncbi:hypothetical protein NDU88_002351 [Pleurodeles waltl]|uniref:Uncharacterized protein n=1 Tax=Pleurodeles waltl TaxID=8319 RepID=A0AAV7M1B2_PLEWA|nr:hypothetical protein NDU88_002351 [Pleurodeles waltl]
MLKRSARSLTSLLLRDNLQTSSAVRHAELNQLRKRLSRSSIAPYKAWCEGDAQLQAGKEGRKGPTQPMAGKEQGKCLGTRNTGTA